MNDCVLCDLSILTPDGAVRCSTTFMLATGLCDKLKPGHTHIWKPAKVSTAKPARKKRTKK